MNIRELQPEFQRFETLSPEAQKHAVRDLHARVSSNEEAFLDSDVQQCVRSPMRMARILVYLLIQEAKIPVTSKLLRAILISELELLRRAQFDKSYSRMPLYYAVRSYLERIKADESLLATSAGDVDLLRELESELSRRKVDRDGQPLPVIKEALKLIRNKQQEEQPVVHWEKKVAIAAGIAFLALLLVVAMVVREPTDFQIFVFRTILALAAGAFGSTIPGLLHVNFSIGTNFVLRAAGALALFAVVYLVNPPQLFANEPPRTVVLDPTASVDIGPFKKGECARFSITGQWSPGQHPEHPAWGPEGSSQETYNGLNKWCVLIQFINATNGQVLHTRPYRGRPIDVGPNLVYRLSMNDEPALMWDNSSDKHSPMRVILE